MKISAPATALTAAWLLLGVTGVQAQTPAKAAEPMPPTTERFQDWGITCADQQGQRFCTLGQEVRRREDSRRLVLMEVKPAGMQRASAGLTLPFGLTLKSGADLQIDGGSVIRNLPYQTCLPQGCLVPMTFDAGVLNALRRGKSLKISAPVFSGGAADFTVSLAGFGDAYARMVELAGGKRPTAVR